MTEMSPKVFIVTPIHNGIVHTKKFLKSLEKSDYKNLHVIIINDGSTDDSTRIIKQLAPNTTVLEGDGTLWWSGATNLGVKYAMANGGEYVYTVNNDVVVDHKTITRLIQSAKQNPKSLIGNTIYDIEDRSHVWYYGARFNRNLGIVEHDDGAIPPGPRIRSSEWLTGMGVLVPIGAYRKAGLYDSRDFPQYTGDMEFSLRAQRNGFKLLVDTEAKIYTDTESAWINSNIGEKSWRFLWDMYFGIRSPYWLKMRYKFYKRYWGKGWAKAYTKANISVTKGIALPFAKAKILRKNPK